MKQAPACRSDGPGPVCENLGAGMCLPDLQCHALGVFFVSLSVDLRHVRLGVAQ